MLPPFVRSTLLLAGTALVCAGCGAVAGLLLPGYDGPHPREEGLTSEAVVVRVIHEKQEAPSEVGVFYADRVAYLHSSADVNRLAYVEARELRPALARADIRVGDTLRISTQYVGVYFIGVPGEDVPNWNPELDEFEGTFPIARQKLVKVEKLRAAE
ncbi:MAG TPA: hypothetical protein VFQ76_14105 [Longimicrobiaceae bacterium]|nr:hypothetical protein [Longimicrobiaceae bacterium]